MFPQLHELFPKSSEVVFVLLDFTSEKAGAVTGMGQYCIAVGVHCYQNCGALVSQLISDTFGSSQQGQTTSDRDRYFKELNDPQP